MLKSLSLENFRNYGKYSLNLDKTTIIVGPNGIGKTNIIEAVYLLSTARSWRTGRDNEVVRWGSDLARITAGVLGPHKMTLEMVIQRQASLKYPQLKIIKINGIKKRLADILGKMPSVLFSPEELELIGGPPMLRRRFLDILLCQIDKKYTLALLDLAKIIRGRNRLLFYIKQGKSKADELNFWDENLITLGSFIIKKRQKIIAVLNCELSKIYQTVSGAGETLEIKYRPTVTPENFSKIIAAQRQREIENTTTLFGPHRDDLIFLLEGKDLTTFGSRGEYRSAVLALKAAELAFLKNESDGLKPILLLDDIFSELDKNRRLHLAKIIGSQQTIITTTDLHHIEENLREKAKIIELK